MAKRNLVVIVADTLRDPRPLGVPGTPLMPFLDSFAPQGVSFGHLLASSSWTAPAHVSLLTGVDPWETHFQVPGAPRRPPPSESLADKWTKEGGVSAAFSANFVVTPVLGTATGYTRFNPGFPAGTAGKVQLALQFAGYERLLYWAIEATHQRRAGPLGRLGAHALDWGGAGLTKAIGTMRSGETLARALQSFLRRRPRQNAPPLHLFFNLVEAHEPYLDSVSTSPDSGRRTLANMPSINMARLTDALRPVGNPASFLDAYRASLPAVDAVFRRLVEILRKGGVLDNAVLVFLSDHGQNLGEHGFYGHGYYLYDELVKIPGYLWEFRDGRPVPVPGVPEEWVDHRHVFDLLSTVTPDGAPVVPADTLELSLLRRGPATSYFEGPVPRPPGGFVFKTPQSEIYRMLRVQRGGETALVMSDVKGGQLRTASAESPDPVSAELDELGRQVLASIRTTPAAGSGAQSEMDAKVDARLKSWGYD